MPTLNEFFAPSPDDIARALKSASTSPAFAPIRDFEAAAAGSLSSTVHEEVQGVLDVSIAGILVRAWSKHEEVKKQLAADGTSLVPLLEHTIESSHSPYIQVTRSNLPLFRINLSIKLEVAIEGLILKIRDHKVQEIAAGKFTASGTLSLEGVTMVEKKSKPLDIPASYKIRQEEEVALAAASD